MRRLFCYIGTMAMAIAISVVTVASGSVGIVPVPADSSKIDSSKVRFLPQRPCSVGMSDRPEMRVMGMVTQEVDLSDDLTAQQILGMGIAFGVERCPKAGTVWVILLPGDPATFTAADFPRFERWQAVGAPQDGVYGGWFDTWPNQMQYDNRPKAFKQSQASAAQKARQRDAALAQQRQVELRRQSEIAARSAAFVKANHVEHFATLEQLTANPFVYKGQVLAIIGEFQQMNSATQGLFANREKVFVVSGIPAARFRQQKTVVMLAGRVVGNIEIKRPVLGSTLVPHLSYVGSALCQQYDCSDYNFSLK